MIDVGRLYNNSSKHPWSSINRIFSIIYLSAGGILYFFMRNYYYREKKKAKILDAPRAPLSLSRVLHRHPPSSHQQQPPHTTNNHQSVRVPLFTRQTCCKNHPDRGLEIEAYEVPGIRQEDKKTTTRTTTNSSRTIIGKEGTAAAAAATYCLLLTS